ncbi:hypothetical protein L0337_33315 [candidate division KSB1 bacterium]|nr:hypothetical protein [candidate division KSB1 bacterium]
MRNSPKGGLETPLSIRSGAWALLSIICFLAILCYLNFPLGYNQTVYHYMGTVLKDGGAPYRDFVDRKGPFGLLIYGLAAVSFGESDLAFRFFDWLILSGIGICLYKFIRKTFSPLAAFGGAALWFMHALLDGPGNTGDVTNLIVLGVLAAAILLENPSVARLFAVGLVTAAIGWVKPTAWLIVSPMLIYTLRYEPQALGKSLTSITFGSLLFSGSMIAYLYFTRSLTGFYEAVVLDPILAYVPKTQLILGHNMRGFLKWLLADPVFRIGGLLGLFWEKAAMPALRFARLAVIGGLLAVFVESRFWPYHFTPVLPFLAFGALIGLRRIHDFFSTESAQKLKSAGVGSVAIGIFLLILPPLILIGKGLRVVYLSAPNSENRAELFALADLAQMYRDRLQVVQTLRPRLRPEDETYVLGNDPGLYLVLQKRTACRHANPGDLLYDYADANSPAHRRRWRDEILSFLQNRQPDWLLVDRNLWEHIDAEAKQAVAAVIEEFYEKPQCVASYWLYHKI